MSNGLPGFVKLIVVCRSIFAAPISSSVSGNVWIKAIGRGL
jgi:hypothetical protein